MGGARLSEWRRTSAISPRYEPVSAWQFPANREINREFCDFGAFGCDISTKSPCAAVVFQANSLQKLTGKLFAATGNFSGPNKEI
jgi:hypothetical protein